MSSNSAGSSGRGLILAGAVGLSVCLIALTATLAVVQAQMVEFGYGVDPGTGYVQEWNSSWDRSVALTQAHALQFSALGPLSGAALAFIVLLVAGARRAERELELRLSLLVVTILYPLILGLCVGLLTTRHFAEVLVVVHESFLGQPVSYTGWEQPVLEACSHVRAFATAQTFALGLAGFTLVLFVPAARSVWQAGQQGLRLGVGWCLSSIGLCGLGLLALMFSQPHHDDRQRVLASCGDTAAWTSPLARHPNLAKADIRAVVVESCRASAWRELESAAPVVGVYQLSASGTLGTLQDRVFAPEVGPSEHGDLDLDDFGELLDEQIQESAVRTEAHGHETPTRFGMLLYADRRAPLHVVNEQLATALTHGVGEVLVLADFVVAGELRSVGTWRRRVYCPVARISIDTQEAESSGSWGDFVLALLAHGR